MRILGHRGASADALENTLQAFTLALAQGADGVELDARVCRSGEVVVFHDETLARLGARPEAVRDLPWSVLRAVPLAGPAGEGRIPLLAEVLAAVPRPAVVNVELKAERWSDGRVAESVGPLLAAHADHVLVSSFDPRCLFRLALSSPGLRRGLLLDPDRPAFLQERLALPLLGRDAVHPAAERTTESRVRAWHAQGRAVAVWTVDDAEVAGRLDAWGVDTLITNRPGRLRAELGRSVPTTC